MTDHPRLRNVGVFIVLALIYIIPAIWVDSKHMLDVVSGPMLIFGLYALFLIVREAFDAFWSGRSDRTAYALFGLSLLLFSVDVMRSYGLLDRNDFRLGLDLSWMGETHLYPAAIYIQFVGLYYFTRASTPPQIEPRRNRLGQFVAGAVIGIILTSSIKFVEPLLALIGKLLGRVF